MELDWEVSIAFVLKMEGGYVNDPNDPGGETNFGISKSRFPNLDIKNLSVEQAKEIYKREYWEPCQCDDLPEKLAISIFDMAVNMGVTKAKRTLQMALGVTVDGMIGPKTLEAAARAKDYIVKRFLAERMAEYCRIIMTNPSLVVFGRNWSHRVISLTILIFGQKEN